MRQETYDQLLAGTWEGYLLPPGATRTSIWTPAGTVMHWSHGPAPLRYHRLQHFWANRWYTLSGLYRDRDLYAMYAQIIQPPALGEGATYTDLGLTLLVNPDGSHEVLDRAEFDHTAQTLHYPEAVRLGALTALDGLLHAAEQRGGPFLSLPLTLPRQDYHLLSIIEAAALLGNDDEAFAREEVI
jgi:protein associated with RNAse G/E